MNLSACLFQEMRHRPFGWLLALLALAMATACVVSVVGIIRAHDAETEAQLAALHADTAERMKALNNEARLFSKSLGFNTLVLPKAQDLGRFWGNDASDHFLPESVAATLGAGEMATLNHLLPMLRQRIDWPAYGGTAVLIGIRGQIYIKNPAKQQPIQEEIQPGTIVLGHSLAQGLGATPGSSVTLRERPFTVARVVPAKGNADDISALVHLDDLQELLDKDGQLSGILALSCDCAGGEPEPIQLELDQLADGLQVSIMTVRANARQRARQNIRATASAQIEEVAQRQASLRAQLTTVGSAIGALVAMGAALFVFTLSLVNARERRGEIAILRAIGCSRLWVLQLFLWKAGLLGLLAGLIGVAAGALIAQQILGGTTNITTALLALIGCTATAKLATVIPALSAATTDPATVLNQE